MKILRFILWILGIIVLLLIITFLFIRHEDSTIRNQVAGVWYAEARLTNGVDVFETMYVDRAGNFVGMYTNIVNGKIRSFRREGTWMVRFGFLTETATNVFPGTDTPLPHVSSVARIIKIDDKELITEEDGKRGVMRRIRPPLTTE